MGVEARRGGCEGAADVRTLLVRAPCVAGDGDIVAENGMHIAAVDTVAARDVGACTVLVVPGGERRAWWVQVWGHGGCRCGGMVGAGVGAWWVKLNESGWGSGTPPCWFAWRCGEIGQIHFAGLLGAAVK
eukprot:359401-Chlamydomonas_euryale.AAC.7